MTASSAASQRAALIERFTAPGQPFEMGERTVRGVPMRVYTTGSLTRRDIALASMGAADWPFLICRDERWSYAEQARIIAGLARCLAGEPGLRKATGWRLVSFKVPARVVFRSAPLPRTQSGTVLKRDLRSAIASELRDG